MELWKFVIGMGAWLKAKHSIRFLTAVVKECVSAGVKDYKQCAPTWAMQNHQHLKVC